MAVTSEEWNRLGTRGRDEDARRNAAADQWSGQGRRRRGEERTGGGGR